jgi:hypothetical protein
MALRRASSLKSTAIDCPIPGSFLKWNQATFCPFASWTVKLAGCSTTRHGRGKRPVISSGLAADPSNEKALFWNPAGASFEQALAVLETPDGIVGVIGGTEVFGIFLDRYERFPLVAGARCAIAWWPTCL